RDVSSGALQSEESVKVEFDALYDPHAWITVAGVYEGPEPVCAGAAVIVPNDDDIRCALATVFKCTPGMKDRINGPIGMYRRSNWRSILACSGALFDTNRGESRGVLSGVEGLIDRRRVWCGIEVVVADVHPIFTLIRAVRDCSCLHVGLIDTAARSI